MVRGSARGEEGKPVVDLKRENRHGLYDYIRGRHSCLNGSVPPALTLLPATMYPSVCLSLFCPPPLREPQDVELKTPVNVELTMTLMKKWVLWTLLQFSLKLPAN